MSALRDADILHDCDRCSGALGTTGGRNDRRSAKLRFLKKGRAFTSAAPWRDPRRAAGSLVSRRVMRSRAAVVSAWQPVTEEEGKVSGTDDVAELACPSGAGERGAAVEELVEEHAVGLPVHGGAVRAAACHLRSHVLVRADE